ncbi:MAG: hypothetical protein R3F62_03015 [Planctomycetota bacterium]
MSSTRDPQPLTAGHRAPAGDRAAVERMAGAGAAAYGELLPAGARATLGWLRLGPQDELLDLGSGSGNLVIQAALESEVGRARGVELSRFRHRLARRRWATALRELPRERAHALRRRVRLEFGDLRRADVSRATVLYAGSTCFPDALLDGVAELALAAPGLRLLLSTRALAPRWAARLPEVARLRVPTTWDPNAWLYAYSSRSVSRA